MMGSRLSGFVEGVFIEVLWDIEKVTEDGRREGHKVMESVWWRAEVQEVKTDRGITVAKIRHDSMGEFEAQAGEVRVFPFHMLVSHDDDVTQLRWRYYESSGDLSYSQSPAEDVADHDVFTTPLEGSGGDCQSCVTLHEHVEELSRRMDEIERFIKSQGAIYSRVSATCTDHQTCQELFGLLRHKVSVVMQKPLLGYRPRSDSEQATTVFDWSCAGNSRAEVDCSVAQFEKVCCYVKRICGASYFTVDGNQFTPRSVCLPASTGAAEILFSSLHELCQALGIHEERDVMEIARKERPIGRMRRLEDGAVRLAGTFLVDRDDDATPAAILICRSLHEGMSCNQMVEVLSREDRDLNPRTAWYKHSLKTGKLEASSLLKYVYLTLDASNRGYKDVLRSIRDETSCFALRWRPLPNPNPKTWTRTMFTRPDFAGYLEVEIPYILFRGANGIAEVSNVISNEYLKRQLSS